MHKAPIAERRKFYKYKLAADSFAVAESILHNLKKKLTHMEDWQRYSSWLSFSTCYFRPFAQKPKAYYAINDDMVPLHLKSAHASLRSLRNQVFAHTEADLLDTSKNQVNAIVVKFTPTLKPKFGIAWPMPRLDGGNIERYQELLQRLREECDRRSAKIWEKWLPNISFEMRLRPHAIWTLNLSEQSDEVFVVRGADDS